MKTNYDFANTVWNGYNTLITTGTVTLSTYNELQAVADTTRDLNNNVAWNTPTSTLTLC